MDFFTPLNTKNNNKKTIYICSTQYYGMLNLISGKVSTMNNLQDNKILIIALVNIVLANNTRLRVIECRCDIITKDSSIS